MVPLVTELCLLWVTAIWEETGQDYEEEKMDLGQSDQISSDVCVLEYCTVAATHKKFQRGTRLFRYPILLMISTVQPHP
jgi:hypothetical protein